MLTLETNTILQLLHLAITLLVDVILQRMLYLSYSFQHKLPLFPHLFSLSFYLAIQILTFICICIDLQ